jgi:hypothetical protein
MRITAGTRLGRLNSNQQTQNWLRPVRLLIAAVVFHLLVSASVTLLGHYEVLPGVFDRNGIAVGIASDSIKARQEAVRRSGELVRGEVRKWLQAHSPFYVKAYSLCFATFGLVFGANILSVEPLNGLCYLIILVLVYQLAREFADGRIASGAAAAVALWPSFVLHTTQLLKDPVFIAAMLAFVLVNVRLLSTKFSWRSAMFVTVSGVLAAAFVWLSRDTMGEILIATTVLACALLPIRLVTEYRSTRGPDSAWRARIPSLAGLLLLIAFTFGVTRFIPTFERLQDNGQPVASSDADSWTNSRRPKKDDLLERQNGSANRWSRAVARIGKLRQDFASEFSDAGSNIDADISLRSTGEIIRYLPRAVMVGYLAPFPSMWFGAGLQVSRAGRLLSGMEMLATYLVEALALFGLWLGRRRFSLWLLWLVSAMGLTSLGLVVLNVGALYRLRYIFLILLIIVATETVKPLSQYFKRASLSRAPMN